MDVASLAIAIASAGIALYALRWARVSAKASQRSAAAAERTALAGEDAVVAAGATLEIERERHRVDLVANTPTLEIRAVFDPVHTDVVCYLHNHGPTLARSVTASLRDQSNEIVLTSEAPIAALQPGADETVVLSVPTRLLEGLRRHQLRVEEAFRPFGIFLGPDSAEHGIQHAVWLDRDADTGLSPADSS